MNMTALDIWITTGMLAVIIFALVIIDGRALKWLRPGDNPA
mgnify:CR=1 FL=1